MNDVEVIYHYDIEDPLRYASNNNRLEYYDTFDTSDPQNPVLLSTTWYYYNESGNVTQVVTSEAGTDQYESTRLAYARNGQAVSYVMGESWTWTGPPADPANYDIAYAHEYRYDSGRQRYLDRLLNIPALMQGYVVADSQLWTDYNGDEPYGDFTIKGGNVTNIRSFEPHRARTTDPLRPAGDRRLSYGHDRHDAGDDRPKRLLH